LARTFERNAWEHHPVSVLSTIVAVLFERNSDNKMVSMDRFLDAAIQDARQGLADGDIPIGSVIYLKKEKRIRLVDLEISFWCTQVWRSLCQKVRFAAIFVQAGMLEKEQK
jgi:hypothetical protein